MGRLVQLGGPSAQKNDAALYLRMPRELMEKAKKEASNRNMTLSRFVRECVEAILRGSTVVGGAGGIEPLYENPRKKGRKPQIFYFHPGRTDSESFELNLSQMAADHHKLIKKIAELETILKRKVKK